MGKKEHPTRLAYEKNGVVYVSGVGLELAQVAKVTNFLADLSLRAEANDQFEERFATPKPARTVVGVSANSLGGKCVIKGIAHR